MNNIDKNDYFSKLKKPVMNRLKSYETDFLIHDKKELSGFKGTFILGARTTGTNILLFEDQYLLRYGLPMFNSEDSKPSLKTFYITVDTFIFGNEWYFIGVNNQVREVSKDEALHFFISQKNIIEMVYHNQLKGHENNIEDVACCI